MNEPESKNPAPERTDPEGGSYDTPQPETTAEPAEQPSSEPVSQEGPPSQEATPEQPEQEHQSEEPADETLQPAFSGEPEPEAPQARKRWNIPAPVQSLLFPFLFWWAGILVCELVIRAAAFETMSRFPTAVLFSAAAAAAAAALTTFPTLAGKLLSWLIAALLYLIYAVQLVYHYVFNAFVSLVYVSVGGDAITQFTDIVIDAILHCLPGLLIMAVPPVSFHVLRHLGRLVKKEGGVKVPLVLLACAVVLSALSVLVLPLGGKGVSSPYTAFHSASATVDRWTEHFGLLTAEVLDLKRLVAGSQSGPAADGQDLTAGSGNTRNVLPGMDFDALNALTDQPELQSLNNYFASLSGTGQNAYTGLFEGYNLIEICAESFSPYVVDPELTPTLYRLSHEGIVFENFYNSFPSVTSDGEYSLCMGMMINLKRVSFASSMNNYVPYCMGNMFSSIGVPAYAYHNNYAVYYNRINTHSNMGYNFKAIDFGLDMEKGHPASDLEMFQKTVDDYIGEEQFHAYYMTYSGHAPYNFEQNEMCIKNAPLVAGLDASEPVRAYYCGELELERALTYLVGRLEEAGIADRTVIVLTGDHYPYALSDEAYAELAGGAAETDPFWRFQNAFLCWTGGMKEPLVVDDYCCTQDILPTMLNLFGFSYDSRMLTGRDVLADCVHAAVLRDGSVLTKEFLYNSASGELVWQQDEHDEEYAQTLISAVENQFTVAADVLDFDYYQFAFSSLDLSEGRVDRPVYASYIDTPGTYYEQAADVLVREGITFVTNNGCYGGERVLIRSELIAMASRWLGLTGSASTLHFTDVAEDNWVAAPLAGVLAAGLLPEFENAAEFQPNAQITTEYAAEFISRLAQYIGHPDPSVWVESLVNDAMEQQTASSDTAPRDFLTRGAIACILADMIEYAGGTSGS